MMNFQLLVISMSLIVLSLVHVDASKRQAGQCPSNISMCTLVQCSNGGQCIDDKTSSACFTCQCAVGFTGMVCETSITAPNTCNPPCQNGGQCQQTATNTSACVCTAEYTGAQCETILATHPCVTSPTTCQNGGTCSINGPDFLCHCPTGWTGTNCQTQETTPTTCDPNPCGAYGTCEQIVLPAPTGLTIFCRCQADWTGKFCDVSLSGTTATMTTATMTTATMTTATTTSGQISSGCASNPCLNGGQCFNTGNTFICLCRQQFSGPTCAVQSVVTTPFPTTPSSTNACLPNPCNNGGSCYRYGNSFVCVCTPQYTGQICDMVKTPTTPSVTTPSSTMTCANQPCLNGATCYNVGNSYFCYCGTLSNFSGKNCEVPKAPTADSICPLNCSPGHCVATGDRRNPYACMCEGVLTSSKCKSG
jgi:hypothetical protein